MAIKLNADQRRVYANIKHRFGPLREADIASWSSEDIARVESWYHSGEPLDSTDIPAFLAEALVAAKAEVDASAQAKRDAAVREIILAAIDWRLARDRYEAAEKELARILPRGNTPIIYQQNVIIPDGAGSFRVSGALLIS